VLMSSIAGLRGAPGLAAYSATKGGVRLLAKSVALEHAADNIRCNSVHPGSIATPIWGKIPTGAEGNRRNAPIDPSERAAAVVPLTRVGEAQDIANGVLFLCTEAASYVTDQELVIDGGMKVGGWVGLCGIVLLLPNLAAADSIPGSSTQVGAWRVTAFTRNQTGIFNHCSLYRVQNEGFGLALNQTVQGVWTMAAEAPTWNLVAKESYTATLQVGSASYTATGRALDARGMTFKVAPEIFGQLKSGQQFSVSANQKRYTISLDGIEAAQQRTRDCIKQYAMATRPPNRM